MSTHLQIWIDPPYPGESFSSFLDRAACFYCLGRRQLIKQICPEAGCLANDDLDYYPSSILLIKVMSAIGLREVDIPGLIPTEPGLPLYHLERSAYCPACFMEDLKNGNSPYFRQYWASGVNTLCDKHLLPMFTWKSARKYYRKFPHSWVVEPDISIAGDCPFLFDDYQASLQCSHDANAIDSPTNLLIQLQKIAEKYDRNTGRTLPDNYLFWSWLSRVISILRQGAYSSPESPIALLLAPKSKSNHCFEVTHHGATISSCKRATKGLLSNNNIGWRRAVLWLVARALFGSKHDIPLVNGECIPASSGLQFWESIIQPMVPPSRSNEAERLLNCLEDNQHRLTQFEI